MNLIDREVSNVQSGCVDVYESCDKRMLDVYREKPIRLTVKVQVPLKEHPKFNFVGKLLGPKGNSLKRMQEETLTKMAVLGRGSMRDRDREEQLRVSRDPKYLHLMENLHVEIVAFAPPAEAYARLSYAITEVRKYLIPDSNDHIRQLQMKELEILSSPEKMISDPSLQLLKTVSPLHAMQPLLVPSSTYLSSPPHHSTRAPPSPLPLPSMKQTPRKTSTALIDISRSLSGSQTTREPTGGESCNHIEEPAFSPCCPHCHQACSTGRIHAPTSCNGRY